MHLNRLLLLSVFFSVLLTCLQSKPAGRRGSTSSRRSSPDYNSRSASRYSRDYDNDGSGMGRDRGMINSFGVSQNNFDNDRDGRKKKRKNNKRDKMQVPETGLLNRMLKRVVAKESKLIYILEEFRIPFVDVSIETIITNVIVMALCGLGVFIMLCCLSAKNEKEFFQREKKRLLSEKQVNRNIEMRQRKIERELKLKKFIKQFGCRPGENGMRITLDQYK